MDLQTITFNNMKATINIKPLSVNQAWRGRRFKTDKYESYERECLLLLKATSVPAPPYELRLSFGFSNYLSDIDNPMKPFIDILQKKFSFDDRDILRVVVDKVMTDKGKEFVSFELKTIDLPLIKKTNRSSQNGLLCFECDVYLKKIK